MNASQVQLTETLKRGVNGPLPFWNEAIHRPGAAQMQHVRNLMESRPFLSRVPDQSLVAEQFAEGEYIAATRGRDMHFYIAGMAGKSKPTWERYPANR